MARQLDFPNVGSMWTLSLDATASRVDSSKVCAASHALANFENVTFPAAVST